ncbi:MAG: SDR family oxidoreductase [Planctomycetes bacterium]|nr:SDR family oxidoreductase [Planctomycetota bacterium]
MRLAGKVACVTGGGRGIGRAVALALAGEGADVGVTARTVAEIETVAGEIRARGRRAVAVPCDVRDPQAVARMIDSMVAALGRLDILINNAGGGAERNPVVDSDPDRWVRGIEVNLLGPYFVSRAAIPHLVRAGGGKIINIGSGLGRLPRAGSSCYCSAKAGLWMLTRCLAMEVWKDGIEVNEVAPGPVWTRLTADVFDPVKPPLAPSERVKQPEECVPIILFLAAHPPGGPTGQSFSLARRPL